jgi:hypothetical protein
VEKRESVFHVMEDRVSEEITVERDPPREGIANTFAFSNREAMWIALSPYHNEEDIKSIFIALAVYGSVDVMLLS